MVDQYVELKDGTRVLEPPRTAAGVRTVAIPPLMVDDLEQHLVSVALGGPDSLVFPSRDAERSQWAAPH